ncbi:MAG: alkaline phosphatase family protein [Nocardioides sp.]
MPHRRTRYLGSAAVAALATGALVLANQGSPATARIPTASTTTSSTRTPIKHVVVLFDENVSYDHYFGTYPKALNLDGTPFQASKHTPANDNLLHGGLLNNNPNEYNPSRLSPSEAMTCDQNHNYGPEQQAEDNGAMDMFVQKVSVDSCTGNLFGEPGLTMDYYDGNTVTALWNYAQHYAMSDRAFDTTFGPSTPGALNLVSGQTHGFEEVDSVTGTQVPTPGTYVLASPDSNGVGTVINDPDPAYDDCSDKDHTSTNTLAAAQSGQKNIGDLLNARGVTWGWFQGGFAPSTAYNGTSGYALCDTAHSNQAGASVVDYSPHHNPFQYYASTANPHHLPPTSVSMIGKTDQANHQYDLSYFSQALKAGNLPAVSFLKASEFQDGHAGYSDPIDEQNFLIKEINAIQGSQYWKSTAIFIAYDDSDGWYDHVDGAKVNGSSDAANDSTECSSGAAPLGGYQDRCGYGPRLPLLAISPYSKVDYVDHKPVMAQASILKFIEDNWGTGRIGDASFDATAGSLNGMFDFGNHHGKHKKHHHKKHHHKKKHHRHHTRHHAGRLILGHRGQVTR